KLVAPRAYTPLWPTLLWLATVLFLGDVAVRRVAPDVDRMRKAVADQWKKLRGQEVAPPVEYMEKLKSRKAEVGEQLDRSRAATRFEASPPAATVLPDEPLPQGRAVVDAARAARVKPEGSSLAPEQQPPEHESYTNRLLKAKQKVWEEREKEKRKGNP
ncbi:MAG: hypothetical protein JO344_12465, partial [Planctomycetaceae bacterium]|nr:hypothetical protein [Planctomycetaceae bacterium]